MSHFDALTKCWHGLRQPPILNPAASLGQVIINLLERTPDKVFEICADSGAEFTCRELRLRMIRAALNLTKRYGLTKGDVVCMAVENSPRVTASLLGCFLVGAPAHALHAHFEESDLMHLMGITKPKLVFCNGHNLATVKRSLDGIGLNAQILVLDAPETEETLFSPVDNEDKYQPPYLGDSDKTVAAIVCSSGTTNLPKAVCVSHAQLIAPYVRVTGLGVETFLCFSSLYWGSAFQMLMLALFNGGTRITTAKSFSPSFAGELIAKYRVTTIFTPPPMLADLVDHWEANQLRFPSLRIVGTGGCALPEALRKRADALLNPEGRVFLGYSMSEFGGIIALDMVPRAGSVGMLATNVTARIVSEDGTRVLGPNEEGEIQASYPHRFIGYYANPEETAAFFTPDGFIQTGDIGRFDADGFLYITDRRKSMIRYRNFQIAPAQLEALIVELAGISQAVVVGLPDPKVASNDLATALVVVRGGSVSAEEIVAHVDGRVPDYKRLRGGVFIVESLPRTGNDKIDRRRATKLARGLSQLC
ncbi:4-coumarate--CoA ligase-like 1 [Culex quinquefasciatus]|uniref:4-coumarate--CoA ligase-like 1 n=1 Tax=Culex quinquefasciatus TaxID=7176 RepID=UPI0018E3E41B|nr:4-coumarate--CoA ligase-like 1 [Culex quinquefasciatus]